MSSKQNPYSHSPQDSTPNKQNPHPLRQERTIPEGDDSPTIILKSTKSRQQNPHSPAVRQTAKQERAIIPEIIEEGTKSKQPNTNPTLRQVSIVRDDEDTVILKGTRHW